MRTFQQTLWLTGFTGVSTACIISFLFTDISSVNRPSVSQPNTLLAANTDQDQLVTLHEVRTMLDAHFARLDANKDGIINPDEYARRHISLFLTIDADSNQKLSRAEIRLHNIMRSQNKQIENTTQSLLYNTAYED